MRVEVDELMPHMAAERFAKKCLEKNKDRILRYMSEKDLMEWFDLHLDLVKRHLESLSSMTYVLENIYKEEDIR